MMPAELVREPAYGRRGGFAGGRGGSLGAGRGRRLGFHATGLPGIARFGANTGVPFNAPDPETTRQVLQNQADALKAELELVKQRLGELEQEDKPE